MVGVHPQVHLDFGGLRSEDSGVENLEISQSVRIRFEAWGGVHIDMCPSEWLCDLSGNTMAQGGSREFLNIDWNSSNSSAGVGGARRGWQPELQDRTIWLHNFTLRLRAWGVGALRFIGFQTLWSPSDN